MKPKLVFFRWSYEGVVNFVKENNKILERNLEEFFDLTVVTEDCDYKDIYEKYRPDLVMFESGWSMQPFHRIEVKNIDLYPDIPKIGLLRSDPYCSCRSMFLTDMKKYGVETFFTENEVCSEYMPNTEMFFYPIAVDEYYNYIFNMKEKTIPILFAGSYSKAYPWRRSIKEKLEKEFPSFTVPHKGYTEEHLCTGEVYKELIRKSWFVPVCGSFAKYITLKHFEVPLNNSCLITEETDLIKKYGFDDMVSCIFATPENVVEKVNFLLNNKEELIRIINRGNELVKTYHSSKNRPQIYEWFCVQKELNERNLVGKIIQSNLWNIPFEIVNKNSGKKSIKFITNNVERKLLKDGQNSLKEHWYDDAERYFNRGLEYCSYIPEHILGKAIAYLYRGHSICALSQTENLIYRSINNYKCDPDPMELAYYLLSLICQSEIKKAINFRKKYSHIKHYELYKIEYLINLLEGGKPVEVSKDFIENSVESIHIFPDNSLPEWLREVTIMFKASNLKYYLILQNYWRGILND